MSDASVTLPRDEYDMLRAKAELFDHMIETEELTLDELRRVKEALRGPLMSKSDFLKRHPDLA